MRTPSRLGRGCRMALAVVVLLGLGGVSQAQQDAAVTSFSAEHQAALQGDSERLAGLIEDREALQAALEDARENHATAQQRRATLEERQAQQREQLETLAARRDGQDADLEAVGSVLDRHLGELHEDLSPSWLTLEGPLLPARRDADTLVTPEHLETVADALLALTRRSAEIVRFRAPVADIDGEIAPREILRAGDLAAYSQGRFLRLGDGDLPPAMREETPARVSRQLQTFADGESDVLVVDPARGEVLAALARQPSLVERFHQGGAVGYVVVALGGLGLLVALLQYGYLATVTLRLRRQLGNLEIRRTDNPLGRILARFPSLEGHAPEALEARLDEALLAELPRLERGQALVKLLAAVAPLLGLLGTVTGMIVTFQAITVHGSGDPQLMAGGISQALVTTVLGLITAVPLLFAHTALSSRSRHLVGLLEGRTSAALAEYFETKPSSPSLRGTQHAPVMA